MFSSLRFVIPLIIFLSAVVISVWMYQFNGRIAMKKVEQEALASMTVELDQLQRHITLELREGLLSAVQEEVSTLGINPDMKLAFLSDQNDIILASNYFAIVNTDIKSAMGKFSYIDTDTRIAQIQNAKNTLSSQVFLARQSDREHVIGIYPIIMGSTPGQLRPTIIGALFAQRDISRQKELAMQGVTRYLIQFSSVLALISVFLWLFLQARVTRRIKKIMATTSQISADSLGARVNILGSDEVAQVASSIDQMIARWEQAENKLSKLSQGMEQSGEAMVIMDLSGVIEYVNPAYTYTSGYEYDEVVGHMPHWFDSKDDPVGMALWGNMVLGKSWRGHFPCTRKDGTPYPSMLTLSPIQNREGKIINYVVVQQDLTEHENLEKQLRQSQKMEALGTLVGGIAHEFNNTLAGVTGNLYLAKQKTSHLPDVVKRLEVIERLSFKSAELIKSLLSFTRQGIVQKKNILLAPLLDDIIKVIKVGMPVDIEIISDFHAGNINVYGDEALVQQALMNIINNARDAVTEVANPSISIKLKPFSANPEFLTNNSECKQGDYACITISDNGSGINADQLPHIFEPFYTTKEVGVGTGLGLSMAFGSIQSHGGATELKSVEGVGTLVSIYLPIIESAAEEEQIEVQTDVVNGSGETILFVDDNKEVVDSGKSILQSLKYKVLIAKNGREAIAVFNASSDSIDLVLIDVVMPVMGGVEAAKEIRDIKPDIKVIYSTAYDREQIRKSDGIEAENMISKPFKVSELSHILHKLLKPSQ